VYGENDYTTYPNHIGISGAGMVKRDAEDSIKYLKTIKII
jgi:hypothetical protein